MMNNSILYDKSLSDTPAVIWPRELTRLELHREDNCTFNSSSEIQSPFTPKYFIPNNKNLIMCLFLSISLS